MTMEITLASCATSDNDIFSNDNPHDFEYANYLVLMGEHVLSIVWTIV